MNLPLHLHQSVCPFLDQHSNKEHYTIYSRCIETPWVKHLKVAIICVREKGNSLHWKGDWWTIKFSFTTPHILWSVIPCTQTLEPVLVIVGSGMVLIEFDHWGPNMSSRCKSYKQPGFLKLENAKLPAFWFGIGIGRKLENFHLQYINGSITHVQQFLPFYYQSRNQSSVYHFLFFIPLLYIFLYQSRKLEVVHSFIHPSTDSALDLWWFMQTLGLSQLNPLYHVLFLKAK